MLKPEEIKELIPQDVKEYLQHIAILLGSSYNVFLAGGYLRDISLGLIPKDIDIMVVPKYSEECKGFTSLGYYPDIDVLLYSYLRKYEVSVRYSKTFQELTNNSDMFERGVIRLIGIDDYSLSTTDVQFIVYNKPLTQQQVTEDMDFNICQITYEPVTETVDYSQEFEYGHVFKIIKCLHDYNEDRKYLRYERMEAKLGNLDYISVDKPVLDHEPNPYKPTDTEGY